jgi:hypothetical protein
MSSVRDSALVLVLALVGVVGTTSMGRADVIGMCSCKSGTCQTSKLNAKNLTALRAQCRAKSGGHGILSRVRRPR